MKKLTLIIAFLFIGINSVAAQETAISKTLLEGYTTVTGAVTDNTGMPIPGVKIKVQGISNQFVITNLDGKFSILVTERSRLEFSYFNFETHTITISSPYRYSIILHELPFDFENVLPTYSAPMRGVASIYLFNY